MSQQQKGKIREYVTKELFHSKVQTLTCGLTGPGTIPSSVQFFDDTAAGDLYTNIEQARQLSNEAFNIRDLQLIIKAQSLNITAALPESPDLHYFGPPAGTMFTDKSITSWHPPHSSMQHEFFADISQLLYESSVFRIVINQSRFLEVPAFRLATPYAPPPYQHMPSKLCEGGLILPEDVLIMPGDSFTMRLDINQTVFGSGLYLAWMSMIDNNALHVYLADATPALVYDPKPARSSLTQADCELGLQFTLVDRGIVKRSLR